MEKEGLIIKELECTKQGMHSAIAHHLLIDAQLIPEQWLLASFPPSLYIDHDAICYGISLWTVGVSCPGHVPSWLLVLLSLLPDRVRS